MLLPYSIQLPDVTFIPTRINYKDIGEVVEYLYFRGIRRLGSMPFIPIGRGKENYDELTLLDEELLDFYYTLERLRMMYVTGIAASPAVECAAAIIASTVSFGRSNPYQNAG